MKFIHLILLVSLLVISGCGKEYERRVTCSSGFDTGWQYHAYIRDYVHWYDSQSAGDSSTYIPLKGEICTREVRIK